MASSFDLEAFREGVLARSAETASEFIVAQMNA
jgi:hypothetical protein